MHHNYPELHAHDNNYPQLHPWPSVPGHAPIATCGDGTGPDGPLGACMIYRDPVEVLRRQQPLFRAQHRRVGHRGAISEPLYKNVEPCSKALRAHTSTVVRKRRGGHSWRRVHEAGQQWLALHSRAIMQAKAYPELRSPPLPALHNLWPATNPPHTVVMCAG